ncbi:hypothetical protein MKX01_029549 [Papaver californicum]|nr:hypothetical protein MKX01_029549 [Papaver californicum]
MLVSMSLLMCFSGRYLRYLEYEVCYVRNFTDVDAKIIARANEVGEDPLRLSRRYCDEFHRDIEYLHCLPPTVEPYVSDHMVQIIDMIKKILDNGCAYRVDGDVYFSVEQFPNYGQLSGRKLEDNRAGERVASAKEGEPIWESPWGPGRPGWHIKCSAMSAAYLGPCIPPPRYEIAQSCAACNKSNISYWMHNGFVTVDSEKMSKSLGNFFTIRQVIDLYHPLALRIFLMATHYRYASILPLKHYETLHDSEELMRQQHIASQTNPIPEDTASCVDKFRNDFKHSMSDDLHTPVVLAALYDPLKYMNDLLHTRKGKKRNHSQL